MKNEGQGTGISWPRPRLSAVLFAEYPQFMSTTVLIVTKSDGGTGAAHMRPVDLRTEHTSATSSVLYTHPYRVTSPK